MTEQPMCNFARRERGLGHPRACVVCGLGICRYVGSTATPPATKPAPGAPQRVRLVEAGNGGALCRIPEDVLKQVGWKEGDRVELLATASGVVVRKA